jgi:helicase required for RNAi-mediated heterochromatin assembly 1
MDHRWIESSNKLISSKVNVLEADMIVKFADYLVQNGHDPESITILSLYNGQLSEIEKKMKSYKRLTGGAKKVSAKTVDNFQGEENKIILLSLVRSNKRGSIGFLQISNRVCVALSRARYGMYIFGNAKCLQEAAYKKMKQRNMSLKSNINKNEDLWIRILKVLLNNNNLSDCLPLKCVTHGNVSEIKTQKDFELRSEGGCLELCQTRMQCGHSCQKKCHPIKKSDEDPTGHKMVICEKK